jgi:hypothetical protein
LHFFFVKKNKFLGVGTVPKKSKKSKKIKSRNPYALPALARNSAGPMKGRDKGSKGPQESDWENGKTKEKVNMPRDLGNVNVKAFNIFDYNRVIEFFMKAHFGTKFVVFIRWDEVPDQDGEHNWVWHLFHDHVKESLSHYDDWRAEGGCGNIPFDIWMHPDMTQIIEFETREEAVNVANHFPESHDTDPSGGYGYAEAWIDGEIVTHNT